MSGINPNPPICIAASDPQELSIIELAIKQEGFCFDVQSVHESPPDLENYALTILSCSPTTRIDSWLDYVKGGGVLLVINPNYSIAGDLGLESYEGEAEDGVLSFLPFDDGEEIQIQVAGSISKFKRAHGQIKGVFSENGEGGRSFPGIIEYPLGRGKTLIILFSLSYLISYFHQRTKALASGIAHSSAEKIALAGVNKQFLVRPQIDLLLGFLSRFIIVELTRVDKPIPRLGYLPCGYRSMVTFSFDDFCPSSRPAREAISNLLSILKARPIIRKKISLIVLAVKKVFKEIFCYKNNYQKDVRRLISLFKQYGTNATAFVLPFFGFIKNRPALTGYRGFSRKIYYELKEAGWDVGTHIKPSSFRDYTISKRKFQSRFLDSPKGHRGHQLGWVSWDEDWRHLAKLGYVYDSTWNYGGSANLTWILGTTFPFYPLDNNPKPPSILEIPTVAWIEDICHKSEQAIDEIKKALDLYPGLYNFGAHSWKIIDRFYFDFIAKILQLASQKTQVGLNSNLAAFSEFWRCRQSSLITDIEWNVDDHILSFNVRSFCTGGRLTIHIPNNWSNYVVSSISVNDKSVKYAIDNFYSVHYAIITLAEGLTHIRTKYS